MKKNITTPITILSIMLIAMSVSSITSLGLNKGMCAFDDVILTQNIVDKVIANENPSNILLNLIFIIALSLLPISSILIFKNHRLKSTIQICVDIVMFTLMFLNFFPHILMFTLLVVLLTIHIFICVINKDMKCVSAILAVLTVCISVINLYYIYYRISMVSGYTMETEIQVQNVIGLSNINKICLLLFAVPLIIYLFYQRRRMEIIHEK